MLGRKIDGIERKVEDLKVGDRVDLLMCPYLKDHAIANTLYDWALITEVEHESEVSILISYDSIGQIGYIKGQIMIVKPGEGDE